MAYWLMKSEPSAYSYEDLMREGHTAWSGVSNAAARLNLRAMKVGDEVLVYHTGGEKAVVGIGRIVKEAYFPDEDDPKAVVVDVAAVERLEKPVTLVQIKGDRRFKEWGLVKIGRLSVVPTTAEQFEAVVAMAKDEGMAKRAR